MLLNLLFACADPGVGRRDRSATDGDGAQIGDSAATSDSAPPVDSGGEGITVELGDVVTCADPSARATTPLQRANLGAEWDAQPVAGSDMAMAGGGVTVADFTGDGRLDIYLPEYGTDLLYVAGTDGLVHEQASARLPDTRGAEHAVGGTAVDIDGDEDLDLFVSYQLGGMRLYINDGTGTFAAGTAEAGLAGFSWPNAGSAFGDMDGDGDLDLAVTVLRDCLSDDLAPADRVLWENQGDATFVDVTHRLGSVDILGMQGRLASWIDTDDDGDVDLYLVADAPVEPACGTGNVLYLNDGGAFSRSPDTMGFNIRVLGMGLGVADVNDDGLPDVLVADEGRLELLESSGGVWFDSAIARGLVVAPDVDSRLDAWGVEFADVDNDGDDDAPMVFGPTYEGARVAPDEPDALWRQDDAGQFADVAFDWGWADARNMRGLAVIDLDGNGFVDLIRHEIFGPADAWVSACDANTWLEVDVRQGAPNTRAVGAIIDVVSGDRRWRRWVHAGGTSYNSSTEPTVHFGLGTAAAVDIHVRWPDGATSGVSDVGVNRRVRIRRQ